MTDPIDHPVEFDFGRKYSDGRSEVFVRQEEQVLHCDTFNPASNRSREKFIQKCQEMIPALADIDIADLNLNLIQLADEAAQPQPGKQHDAPRTLDELKHARDEASDAALEAMPDPVIESAEQMLSDPGLIDRIQEDLRAVGIVGEEPLALTVYITGTSRLLDDPLAGIVQGLSSSGKSFVVERTADLFPPEAVLRSTDLTANALYYVEENALVHRFVIAGERAHRKDDDQAEATRALREVLSSKVLRKTLPVKGESGPPVTETVERHGPIAFIETTTMTKLFDEDSNRTLLLAADECAAQTRRVIEHSARLAETGSPETTAILARHHAVQRLLRRVRVRIPFASAIAEQMPDGRPEARRAIGHTLSVIRAVALLHQRQRHNFGPVLENGAEITATVDDYRIARELLIQPLGRLLGGDLAPAVVHFGQRVIARWEGQNFTAAQASERDETVKDASVARRYLNTLADAGTIKVVERGRGSRANLYCVEGAVPEPGAAWLPTVDDLLVAGVETPPTHAHALPGASGRQRPESSETIDLSENSVSSWRPEPMVRQWSPASSAPAEDELATRRTAGDQDGWSPADGSGEGANSPSEDESFADDQADRGRSEGGPKQLPFAIILQAEETVARAIQEGDEGTAHLAMIELGRLIGQGRAEAVEDQIHAEVREHAA